MYVVNGSNKALYLKVDSNEYIYNPPPFPHLSPESSELLDIIRLELSKKLEQLLWLVFVPTAANTKSDHCYGDKIDFEKPMWCSIAQSNSELEIEISAWPLVRIFQITFHPSLQVRSAHKFHYFISLHSLVASANIHLARCFESSEKGKPVFYLHRIHSLCGARRQLISYTDSMMFPQRSRSEMII